MRAPERSVAAPASALPSFRIDARQASSGAPAVFATQFSVLSSGPGVVCACALLAAAGNGIGLGVVSREAALQHPSAAGGQALIVAAFVLGGALGLWYPRRLMLKRLARFNALPQANLPVATGVVAALLLALGLSWLATVTVTAGLERWRGLVLAGWHVPAGLEPLLVLLPLVILAPTASIAALVLVALQGWYRLAMHSPAMPRRAPWREMVQLWSLTPLGFASGALLASVLGDGWQFLAAPLLFFVCAAVTALGHPRASPSTIALPRAGGRVSGRVTAGVVAAGALSAAALVSAPATPPAGLTTVLAPLACGAAAGIWIGRGLAASVGATGWLFGGLAFGAACLVLPMPDIARLLGVGVGAGVSVALAGRVIVACADSVQGGLARIGMQGAGGLLLVLIPTGLAASAWNVGVEDSHGPTGEGSPASRVARAWLSGGLERVGFCPPERPQASALPMLWWIDRNGPRFDALILGASASTDRASAWMTPEAQRLAGRIDRALAPGGRIVLETPADASAAAAFGAWLEQRGTGRPSALRVVVAGSSYEAIVAGPDVLQWLAERPPPGGAVVRLTPLAESATVSDR